MSWGNALNSFMGGAMQGASFVQGAQAKDAQIRGANADADLRETVASSAKKKLSASSDFEASLSAAEKANYGYDPETGKVDTSLFEAKSTEAQKQPSDRFGNAGFGMFKFSGN